MNDGSNIDELRNEVKELRATVRNLTETINELRSKLGFEITTKPNPPGAGEYRIFDQDSCLSRDVSWNRLVGLLEHADKGLTAAELARKWGKSRTRTSEVLNVLVNEGYLVKYRDGRKVKFTTLED